MAVIVVDGEERDCQPHQPNSSSKQLTCSHVSDRQTVLTAQQPFEAFLGISTCANLFTEGEDNLCPSTTSFYHGSARKAYQHSLISLLWARKANRKYLNRKSESHLRIHIGNEAHNHS